MAYNKNFKRNYGNATGTKKSKYTKSEQIAFRLGQEQKIKESIRNNPDSRVAEAYQKGRQGFEPRSKKSLF